MFEKDSKLMIMFLLVMFIFVLIGLYLYSSGKMPRAQPYPYSPVEQNYSGQYAENNSVIVGTYPHYEEILGSLRKQEYDNQNQAYGGNEPMRTCTPLGDPSKLLLLHTKYLIKYEDMLVYVESQFDKITGQYYRVKSDVISRYNGKKMTSVIYYTYTVDGKCVQMQLDTSGLEGYSSSGGNIMKCSGYPLWFVCSEALDDAYFDRYEVYEAADRAYNASVYVYGNGTEELWVDKDISVILKHDVYDSANNKKFGVELLEVGGIA